MSTLFLIVLGSIIIMLVSLAGVLTVWKGIGKWVEHNLRLLVSMAAGVFLILSLTLSIEAFKTASSPFIALGAIVGGALLSSLLFRFIPGFHHHHEDEECDEPHGHTGAHRVLWGDGVHNIGDGILIAASFMAAPALGAVTVVSVFIHEFVQELSEFFVLKQAGYSTKKALLINFMVSGSILIGALLGFFALSSLGGLESILLGLSAGAFFVVVIEDLFPRPSHGAQKKYSYLKHILAFIFGLILIIGINTLSTYFFPEGAHTHAEQENHDHE